MKVNALLNVPSVSGTKLTLIVQVAPEARPAGTVIALEVVADCRVVEVAAAKDRLQNRIRRARVYKSERYGKSISNPHRLPTQEGT